MQAVEWQEKCWNRQDVWHNN